MKRLWNERTRGLIPYVPGEQPQRPLVKLNTNENPYGPDSSIATVLENIDLKQLALYPDPSCCELRSAIAGYYGLTRENVFVGNGSDEVLALAFQAFFEPAAIDSEQKPVLFSDITYSFYPVYARFNQIFWQNVPLNADLEVPVAQFLQPSAGVVLANPNAPTGIALSVDQIEQIVSYDSGRLVLIDEAYVDFGAQSCVDLLKNHDNLLIVQTLSKSRALAGIRLGFALGSADLIEGLERVRDSFNSYTVSRINQQIGVAAFAAGDWFEKTCSRIIVNRSFLEHELKVRGFAVLPSKTNFVFVSHRRHKAIWLYEQLKAKGILVRHFNLPRIENYLRITVGTKEEIERLVSALDLLLI